MNKVFRLPDLGEGLTEAKIHKWQVKVGQSVTMDQVLLSVETAKAIVEIPSPFSGKIKKCFGKSGDTIKTGKPLVSIQTEQTSTTVVGQLAHHNTVVHEPEKRVQPAKQPCQEALTQIKAVPAARQLAARLGVNLEAITPTGPKGVVTVKDVKQAHSVLEKAQLTDKPKPISKMQRFSMASSMEMSHQVPTSTLMDEANVTHWQAEEDVTVRLIQAIVSACKAAPALNAHFDNTKKQLIQLEPIHLGVAMDAANKLYLPVIQQAESQSAKALRSLIDKCKQYAKSGSFPKSMLNQPSLVLSNFGSIAGRYATPMVVPPTVATIGIGQIYEALWINKGAPQTCRLLPISISIDHRALTGGQAARFLKAFIQHLQPPYAWL